MSMPTVRILLVLIFVPAKPDTLEMGKHVKQVDKCTVLFDYDGVASHSRCRRF